MHGLQGHLRRVVAPQSLALRRQSLYRGTSLIRPPSPVGHYKRSMLRGILRSYGVGVSYERGTFQTLESHRRIPFRNNHERAFQYATGPHPENKRGKTKLDENAESLQSRPAPNDRKKTNLRSPILKGTPVRYRGTSLTRKRTTLGSYSRSMPGTCGDPRGLGVCDERGTPSEPARILEDGAKQRGAAGIQNAAVD